MAKRKYNPKKVAQVPALKRKIAELLAANDSNKHSLLDMLIYGHRGYISHSEDDLCKMFDKLYSSKLVEVADKKQALEKEIKEANRTNNSWRIRSLEKDIESLNKDFVRYKEVANLIFEEKVLL